MIHFFYKKKILNLAAFISGKEKQLKKNITKIKIEQSMSQVGFCFYNQIQISILFLVISKENDLCSRTVFIPTNKKYIMHTLVQFAA